jgi:Protein of unknown function (DUF2867)
MAYGDRHTAHVDVPPDRVWDRVLHLGGDPRLYAPRPLWLARTALDAAVGGPGWKVRGPGRALEAGDDLDFWRVVEVHPPTRLRLRALTRMPGTAHLDVVVHASGAGSEIALENTFEPAGIAGHAYWWAELPAHSVVFAVMVRRLAALVSEAPAPGSR